MANTVAEATTVKVTRKDLGQWTYFRVSWDQKVKSEFFFGELAHVKNMRRKNIWPKYSKKPLNEKYKKSVGSHELRFQHDHLINCVDMHDLEQQ